MADLQNWLNKFFMCQNDKIVTNRDILNSKHIKENNLITKFANQDGEEITTKLSNINTVIHNLTLSDNFKIKQARRQIKCNFIAQFQRKQVQLKFVPNKRQRSQ